jgi:O-antigen/teichoic acid export membrane protein
MTADRLVPFVAGEQWIEAIPVFKIFSVGVFFLPFLNVKPLLVAVGRIRLLIKLSFARLIITVPIIFFVAGRGLQVICAAEVLLLGAFVFVNLMLASSILKEPLVRLVGAILMPFKGISVLIPSMVLLRFAVDQLNLESDLGALLILTAPSLLVFLLCTHLFYPKVYSEIIGFVFKRS